MLLKSLARAQTITTLNCLQGIEIVDDRYAGAVMLHEAFHVTLRAETELGKLLHPDVVEQKVHLIEVRTGARFGGT